MKLLKSLIAGKFVFLGLSQAAMAQGTVYVVHGIPGDDLGLPTDLPVDVSVNGASTSEYGANLNVAHLAAAPRVDVLLERQKLRFGKRLLQDSGNGEAASTNVFRGGWDASVRAASPRDTVFGPAPLQLEGDTVYLVYALGSLTSGSFTVLIAKTDAR